MERTDSMAAALTDRYVHGQGACREALSGALSKGGSRGELIQGRRSHLLDLCPTAALEEGLELIVAKGKPGRMPEPGSPCHLTLFRSQENLYFRGEVLRVRDRTLVIRWPEGLWVYDQRSNLRRALSPGIAQVRIPLPWLSSGVTYTLCDHSNRGFSFLVPEGTMPFLPGTPIPELILTGLPGGVLQSSGEVRHVTPMPNGGGFKVGVLLEESSELGLEVEGSGSKSGIFRRLWTRILRRFLEGDMRPLALPGSAPILRVLRRQGGDAHMLVDETPGIPDGAPPPAVVIFPDLGQRKESLEPLVEAMLALFLSQGQPLRVYRVDSPGDPQVGCQQNTSPLHHWEADIVSALERVSEECEGTPILMTQGIKGAVAARLALEDALPPLRGWIALGGEPRLEGSLLSWSGGIDPLAGAKAPDSISVAGIRFAGPSLRASMEAYIKGVALSEGPLLAPVGMAITWFLDPKDLKTDVQAVTEDLLGGEAGPRELRVVSPGSLNLRSAASQPLVEDVANRVYQTLHRGVAPPTIRRAGSRVGERLAQSCTAQPTSQQELIAALGKRGEAPVTAMGILGLQPLVSRVHRALFLECLKSGEGAVAAVGPAIAQLPFLFGLPRAGGELRQVRTPCTVMGEEAETVDFSARYLEAWGLATRRRLGSADPQGLADLDLALKGLLPLSYALRTSGLLSPRDLAGLGTIDENLELWSLLRGEPLSPSGLRSLRRIIGARGLSVARDIARLSASLRGAGTTLLVKRGYASGTIPSLDALRPPAIRPGTALAPGSKARIFAPFLFPCQGGVHSTLLQLKESLAPKGKLVLTALHPGLDSDNWALELLKIGAESLSPPGAVEGLSHEGLNHSLREAGQGLMALYGGAGQGDVYLPSPKELSTSLNMAGFKDIRVGKEGRTGSPELSVIWAGI